MAEKELMRMERRMRAGSLSALYSASRRAANITMSWDQANTHCFPFRPLGLTSNSTSFAVTCPKIDCLKGSVTTVTVPPHPACLRPLLHPTHTL
ncbi:hypothetical protein AB1N83_011694 [Pleurotus pulmonarius]